MYIMDLLDLMDEEYEASYFYFFPDDRSTKTSETLCVKKRRGHIKIT
jgi:hypothetical protein